MQEDLEDFDSYELTNDIITISKLQVALRTRARTLQAKLDQLTKSADTRTVEGLFTLLQQIATLLLDNTEFWTHVLARSQTVDGREAATELFYQLLQQERAKSIGESFNPEKGEFAQANSESSYSSHSDHIVVTLLLMTADDQPLFGEIYSASLLRDVLQEITMMRSRYLMIFEFLWVPQDETETLTDKEMQSMYRHMVEIG
ncbi:DUF1517 domain-containing protein [Kovacikia minuta CCNUW1]|uniref:DUF1517 domain-containing protein n=1 Tax=Kovacikia minuta TaxID=2931930 RepID=UPI001CCA9E7F|nr:DUF1517 domain-containing protein [Kovacikia minuta]UBF25725.1 DUF1517 domain-containing protein [Kovacikia minuta CCNUW1]